MARYTFTYPNVPEAESSMYSHIREVLMSNKVSDADIQRCMMVLSEAFTNAYLHGNKMEPSRHILVNLVINQSWVTADIIDEGSDGSSRALEGISRLIGLPEAGAESGRGIALMKHYADNVSFSKAATGGLKVTVRLKRGTKMKTEITQL